MGIRMDDEPARVQTCELDSRLDVARMGCAALAQWRAGLFLCPVGLPVVARGDSCVAAVVAVAARTQVSAARARPEQWSVRSRRPGGGEPCLAGRRNYSCPG